MKKQARAIAIATMVAGGLLIGAVTVVVLADDRDATEQVDVEPWLTPMDLTHPTPIHNTWMVVGGGVFQAYEWDNRPVSPERKAAEPWYDTRWRPFGHCMADAGYEVRADPSQPFSQTDLDEIVARANAENPDREANKQIAGPEDTDGIAAAFLACANEWLTIPYEELGDHGLRFLEPGEIPEP